MMSFFNGTKGSKVLISMVLAIALIGTYALPITVYADDKPVWSDYENNPQSEIDPAITENVEDAQQQAAEAGQAADNASKAAIETEQEVSDAENAAEDAADIAEEAGETATSAAVIHTEGTEFVNASKAAIETDVSTAKEIIEEKAEIASAAAIAAEDAANAAEAAKIKAQNATSSAIAVEAALEAKTAADTAEKEAEKARAAYDDAQSTLDAAKLAYDNAVAAANLVIDGYNNQIDTYKNTVNNFNLALLRASCEEAAAEAGLAKAAVDAANAKAEAAAAAAAASADAVLNYYTDPAAQAILEAEQALDTAEAVKAAATQNVADKQEIQNEKQIAYNGIVGSKTAEAVTAQNAKVDQLIQAENAAKAAYDAIPSWKIFAKANARQDWINAQNARTKAQTPAEYNKTINATLKATAEYQALMAAQSDVASAKANEAKKAALLADAQRLVDERTAALNGAVKTRDDYLADIKAAVGEDTVNQILAELNKNVDDSVTDVNQTEFDADMYGWANKVKDDFWWQIWHWNTYTDAVNEVGNINKTYTENNFTDWLNQTFPWIHTVKNTDQLIAMAEEAYRQELKLHEEELAFNQAYLAKLAAANAKAEAAARQAEAAAAIARLADANGKLAAAEAALFEAKERVNRLTRLQLDITAALDALEQAKDLVNQAKDDKDRAETAALNAKKAADDAQKFANDISVKETVRFFVLIDGDRPTTQGSQAVSRFTGSLYTLTIAAPDGATPGNGMSLVNEFGDEGADAVESRIKALSSEKSFNAITSAVTAAMNNSYSGYLPDSDWHIDWYDLKWEGDGWHVDGDVVAAKLPQEPVHEVGNYQVRFWLEGSTDENITEVAAPISGNSTENSILIPFPAELNTGYAGYVVKSVTGGGTQVDDNISIKWDNDFYGEHIVTVYYAAGEPEEPPVDNGGNNNNNNNDNDDTTPNTQVILPDEETPAGPVPPTEEVVLTDDAVPAGSLPQTGGLPALLFYGLGALLAGSGAGLKLKNRKYEK